MFANYSLIMFVNLWGLMKCLRHIIHRRQLCSAKMEISREATRQNRRKFMVDVKAICMKFALRRVIAPVTTIIWYRGHEHTEQGRYMYVCCVAEGLRCAVIQRKLHVTMRYRLAATRNPAEFSSGRATRFDPLAV